MDIYILVISASVMKITQAIVTEFLQYKKERGNVTFVSLVKFVILFARGKTAELINPDTISLSSHVKIIIVCFHRTVKIFDHTQLDVTLKTTE